MPKEMLPIVDKRAIQYIVEEAVESGIEDIGSSPKVVLDYFRTRLLCTYKEKISKSDFSYTAAQENPPLVKYMLW